MEAKSSVHDRAEEYSLKTTGKQRQNQLVIQTQFKWDERYTCKPCGMLAAFENSYAVFHEKVEICPIILAGKHVRLEPLTASHEDSLIAAASDGELWKSTVTTVPSHTNMASYIQDALHGEAQGVELPFVIIQKALDKVVGTTRFYDIRRLHRGVAIGYTWLAASAQRTPVNTEAKLLMLTHAFENWRCIRVEFMTHVLNKQSREAILRLGAKEEAILRSHMIMPDGRVRDSVCFSIILEEWPEVKARLANRLSTQ